MSLWSLSEMIPNFEFADRDQAPERFTTSLIFQDFYSVQIMLHMIIWIHNYPARIPLSNRMNKAGLLFCGN